MQDDDRIDTDLQIRMLEKRLTELKGEGAGRGKSGGGKSSAFKPPKAGKVPGGKGGGGGKASIKMKGGGKAKSPKAPEPKPVSAQATLPRQHGQSWRRSQIRPEETEGIAHG